MPEAQRPEGWPFGRLRPAHYRVILADPPWHFENFSEKGERKHAKRHYATLKLGAICNLPVRLLAHPGGALLVLWSTWAEAARCSHRDVMRRWGFRPSSGGVWLKITANALPAFGTGYVLRDACEPFWTGVFGRPPRGLAHTERNAILSPQGRHSEKPPEMHELLERLAPGPRCELFARAARPGWDVWGDEISGVRRQGAEGGDQNTEG